MPTNWSLTQSKAQIGAGTLAFDSNVAAGSFLAVALEVDGATNPTIPAPTDSRGTVYSALRPAFLTTNQQKLSLWGGVAPTSGANTVSTFDTGSFDAVVIAEFAYALGLGGGFTIDDNDDNYLDPIPTGANGCAGDAMTPVKDDELVLMMVGTDNGGAMTFGNGSTMVIAAQTVLSGAGGDWCVLAYGTVLGVPGSFTPTLTGTGGTGTSGAILEALVSAVAEGQSFYTSRRRRVGR